MEAITNNKNMLVATPARICPGFVSGCCNYQRAPGGAGTLTHRPGCPLGCRVTKVGGGFGWVLPPLRLQHPFSGGCTPAMLPRALGRAGASSKRCQTPGEGALRGGRRDGRAKSKAPKISKQGKTSNWPEKKKKKGLGRAGKVLSIPSLCCSQEWKTWCSLRACSFKISLLFQQQISGGFLEKHQILPNSGI